MDANSSTNLIHVLRRRLQRTVECNLIVPVFQAIVDLQGGRIAGFEALSRPGPECDFSDATELFDCADKAGMLWEVESVARHHALHAAADWPDGTRLFLNSSPEVFADHRFAREIINGIESIPGLTPDRVVLEITEQASDQAIGGLERQVELLKDYGFHIAIDDVGAGRSGLNRIVTLRPSWLKLNRVGKYVMDAQRVVTEKQSALEQAVVQPLGTEDSTAADEPVQTAVPVDTITLEPKPRTYPVMVSKP